MASNIDVIPFFRSFEEEGLQMRPALVSAQQEGPDTSSGAVTDKLGIKEVYQTL